MTPQEHTKHINHLFKEAAKKLKDLKAQQDAVIKAYIKELEERKVSAISEMVKTSYSWK